MMSDTHRVGCAIGRNCITGQRRGGAARAVYYVRIPAREVNGVQVPAQPCYMCDACARALAHRHGVDLDERPAPIEARTDVRARMREGARG